MRKRVFKTFAAAALATTIAGTTIIGSTAFADEISTLTQQKQDKQNELDQLQQQAAYLLTEMSSFFIKITISYNCVLDIKGHKWLFSICCC